MNELIKKLSMLKKALGRREPPDPPKDPYARRPVPVRRGPPEPGSAVAVDEPDDE